MKCLRASLHLFLWMMLGSVIGIAVSVAVSELYRFLNDIMPNAFPSYDVGSGKDFFDTLYTSLWFISIIITVFISVYLFLRYDNARFENIIATTDGIYKIRAFLPTYINIYAICDVVSSVIIGLIFTVPFIFVPVQFVKSEGFFANLTEPYKLMSECFGYVFAPVVMILIIALSFVASTPLILKYYRARWFSAFSEV